MNGIDDLRRTLDEHAAGLVDHEVNARGTAVHGRVAAVRRRRRGTVAGAAAAVVAVVGGIALLPDGRDRPEPAERIVGVEVPPELTALGYAYDFSEGIEGEGGRAVARLAASDEPRLVSWATSGDDDRVRVATALEDEPLPRDSADFTDWVYVPAGSDYTVRVTAQAGQPGLAVYTLGDQRPDGITEAGVTFRERVGTRRLIDAAVGETGQSELTVPAAAAASGVTYHYFCSGGPQDSWVEIYIGEGSVEDHGSCRDGVPIDGAEAREGGLPTAAGEDVTIRLVARDANGDVLDDPDVRLGVGVYDEPYDPTTLDGPNELIEFSGHRWELFDLAVGKADRRAQFVRAPRDRGVVVAVIRAEVRDASVELGADGSVRSKGGGGTVTELVEPGDRTGYRVVGGDLREGDRFQIAFYQRAD